MALYVAERVLSLPTPTVKNLMSLALQMPWTNSEKPDEPGTSDAPEYSSLEELSWNTSVAAMDTINKGTAASITSC